MPPKAPKGAPKAAGKKGPPNAMLAKLKMKMELQKAEEDRLRQEAEEEERRIREEERLAEEQRKYEEEERLREREQKKKDEQLARKEAKKMGKSDALDRMRAAGMVLPDVEKIRHDEEIRKETEKNAPPKPKPKPKPAVNGTAAHAQQLQQSDEEEEEEDANAEQSEPSESDAEVDEDDWEAVMERDERREVRHTNNVRIRTKRTERKTARREAKRKVEEATREAEAAQNHVLEKVSNLRSPICCVLGHVDTGKTSLLDRIRMTNVQGGEAGGITQQIGATFFPREKLVADTAELNKKYNYNLDVPGLLVIDTPGHESFTNLRSRGSSLCDIAILVVDIMHGLEQQTRESIRLLREKRCPFIIALNKVDRLYDWQAHENMDIQQTLALQKPHVRNEFNTRWSQVKNELSAEGLNSELYYNNKEVRKFVSVVPTSAKTGEGVCDLILLEIHLVQQFMEGKVTYKDDLQCTVLEVKPITGYGFTIDVILINGNLHEGNDICLCGQNGPVFTQIRSLLTPKPLREMRVRGEYDHHKSIKAAMGVKIAGNDLEYVVPGTQLLVVKPGDDREKIAEQVMKDATNIHKFLNPDGVGVSVQSSTLGALEALLSFLQEMKIPVASIAIGPIHKRHMVQVLSMKRREPRYAVILAFDVVVSDEARDIAKKNDIDIFEAKIIYHLFDSFTRYINEYESREKERLRAVAVFPVYMKLIGDAIHATDPIILPVNVERGQLRVGTPISALKKSTDEVIPIGRVMSMERDNRPVEVATPGMDVAVKINSGESGVTAGRQFSQEDTLISHISRPSVDAVKKFADELKPDDIQLLATLIKVLKVPK
ncbi:putative translation initiation factor IF-2 [Leptomonas pyrrhocoris]|uniref:Eukaryotic translation initiation factor 5B n=1 Tax=Leptomonas pyrrhocoris TaxID=157538 RepID=A0A0N0DYS3_LEPPY|nr:putative translation initiation factor IF-2 [Leptomonas pyrrhocoris]KPA84362.1 putative translation initiation factor IF-2 [Leptomonas pyrrhocoris]|eukprot:XP_015662801.1 putative translation initiation factor IF-2 [Leptomonas pyrrhocoris]